MRHRSSFTRMVHCPHGSYSATAFRAFEIAKVKSPRCGLFFCALARHHLDDRLDPTFRTSVPSVMQNRLRWRCIAGAIAYG
ncbi:hypothetical protein CBM2633_A70301 [Cupriavidus taiwanensis]|uniref:Uncharacterized protein n=1 Tax=Cupriavidus taiwanensis TaxID=164546 RepID=A0A976G183_9BURK|nr:hypothetical protein CBM2615_A240221 [Cupriavidus taiwanensis]SOZ54031.1 hypothetical protein CBM2614_A210223 [Cupriavidus taiwanensis]SOZ56499.1 hypothetical protein CBM2613_A220218 [Cupriavidus taiwanensis]SPA04782.1 hypothetical protein CBM2625_A170219 [Cupriavidus taiwanensis]SPA16326.1 hypothetical protein CBM2633_A70301 [Cupriavidus taiwanensis]